VATATAGFDPKQTVWHHYGYARVSTLDQDLGIQHAALKAAGCKVVRAEKVSGSRHDGRTELPVLLDFVQHGDTLVVTRIVNQIHRTYDNRSRLCPRRPCRNCRVLLLLGLARMGKSAIWLAPGCLSLVVFAWLLTLGPADNAGRAYAVYGGVYIVASLAWSWAIEGIRPDHWDLLGAIVCIVGAGIILLGPRAAA
jgi:small multidrug resistance family-3 protein